MLKPEDVENKAFNRSMMGYNTTEVDQFLDEIVLTLRELYNKLSKVEEEVKKAKAAEAEANKRLAEIEQAKQKIIEEAKIAAKEIIEAAITKAKEISGQA